MDGNDSPAISKRKRLRPGGAVAALLAALLLSGCAGTLPEQRQRVADRPAATTMSVEPPSPRLALFGPPRAVPAFPELTTLSESQRRDFLAYFENPERSGTRPDLRLAAYLESRLAGARFHGETLGARQTLDEGRGNCLSLALATAALADLAGIELDWRLTRSEPVYSATGGLIYSADHVHTRLYDPTYDPPPGTVTIQRPHVAIDFFTDRPPHGGEKVEPGQFAALTYQNLAAEALARGDVDGAFWLTLAGLEHDDRNPDLYNTMALLHRRAGDRDTAERFFRHALDGFEDRLVILRNYRQLLLDAGRESDALAVERRIVALPDPDPYPMLELGDAALADGHARRALIFYERARQTAPYLHEAWWRIAMAHRSLGNAADSREAISMALETAVTYTERKRYKSKLDRAVPVTPD